MSPSALCALRANNLRPKEKRLIIVFSTVDDTKQGVGRAECTEAIGDDYATVAVGREVQIPLPQPTKNALLSTDKGAFFSCFGAFLSQNRAKSKKIT